MGIARLSGGLLKKPKLILWGPQLRKVIGCILLPLLKLPVALPLRAKLDYCLNSKKYQVPLNSLDLFTSPKVIGCSAKSSPPDHQERDCFLDLAI